MCVPRLGGVCRYEECRAQGARSAAQGVETGIASVYASKFQGRRTANGEVYNSQALTAAHPSLPFGARVQVTSLPTAKP